VLFGAPRFLLSGPTCTEAILTGNFKGRIGNPRNFVVYRNKLLQLGILHRSDASLRQVPASESLPYYLAYLDLTLKNMMLSQVNSVAVSRGFRGYPGTVGRGLNNLSLKVA
jgi:hypothetical protein